ncbi:MAG: GNAT family N-acetyltransferase [Candidatus Cybelea sp.]
MLVEIRRAQDRSDFQKLHDLFVEYEADLSEELRHGAVSDVAALDETYGRRHAAFLATCEGDEIGCVAVKAFDARTALMLHLFVRPERRGLGAARLLVTTAIEFARAQGFGRIVLDTNKQQLVPAYLLYRSLGFEECEPFTTVTYEFPTFMQLPLG